MKSLLLALSSLIFCLDLSYLGSEQHPLRQYFDLASSTQRISLLAPKLETQAQNTDDAAIAAKATELAIALTDATQDRQEVERRIKAILYGISQNQYGDIVIQYFLTPSLVYSIEDLERLSRVLSIYLQKVELSQSKVDRLLDNILGRDQEDQEDGKEEIREYAHLLSDKLSRMIQEISREQRPIFVYFLAQRIRDTLHRDSILPLSERSLEEIKIRISSLKQSVESLAEGNDELGRIYFAAVVRLFSNADLRTKEQFENRINRYATRIMGRGLPEVILRSNRRLILDLLGPYVDIANFYAEIIDEIPIAVYEPLLLDRNIDYRDWARQIIVTENGLSFIHELIDYDDDNEGMENKFLGYFDIFFKYCSLSDRKSLSKEILARANQGELDNAQLAHFRNRYQSFLTYLDRDGIVLTNIDLALEMYEERADEFEIAIQRYRELYRRELPGSREDHEIAFKIMNVDRNELGQFFSDSASPRLLELCLRYWNQQLSPGAPALKRQTKGNLPAGEQIKLLAGGEVSALQWIIENIPEGTDASVNCRKLHDFILTLITFRTINENDPAARFIGRVLHSIDARRNSVEGRAQAAINFLHYVVFLQGASKSALLSHMRTFQSAEKIFGYERVLEYLMVKDASIRAKKLSALMVVIQGFKLPVKEFSTPAALEGKLNAVVREIKEKGNFDKEQLWHLAANYYDIHLKELLSGEARLLSIERYKEIVENPGALSDAVISTGNAVQLRTLAYEGYCLMRFIERLRQEAVLDKREVLVVANKSYGIVALAPIREWLALNDIQVIETKIGSSQSHDNPFVIDFDDTQLFSDEEIAMLVNKRPLVVVVDGSYSLDHIKMKQLTRREPRFPDAYQGYRNFFIALNEGMRTEEADQDMKEFQKDNKFLEMLKEDEKFVSIALKAKMLLSQLANEFYQMRLWTPAFGSQPGKLKFSEKRSFRTDRTPPIFDFEKDSKNPTIIVVESAIENHRSPFADKEHPTIPQSIMEWFEGENVPAFYDDRKHFEEFNYAFDEHHGVTKSHVYAEASQRFFRELLTLIESEKSLPASEHGQTLVSTQL